MTDDELQRGLRNHHYVAEKLADDEWKVEKEEAPAPGFRTVIHHDANPMKPTLTREQVERFLTVLNVSGPKNIVI